MPPETSETFTIGANYSSISDLEISAQFFSTNISNVVGTLGYQELLNGCFIAANLSLCQRVHRQGSGVFFDHIDLTNINFFSKKIEGFDFNIRQGFDLATSGNKLIDGELELQMMGTLALKNTRNGYINSGPFPELNFEEVSIDCTGFHDGEAYIGNPGGTCGEPIPKWKHIVSAKYSDGDWSLTARWRYSSSTQIDNLNPDVPTPFAPFRPKFASETGAVHYIDLSGNWDINEKLNLSAGVINLFDQDPPIFGDCCSEQANTFPSSYNPLGRQFFIAARANF